MHKTLIILIKMKLLFFLFFFSYNLAFSQEVKTKILFTGYTQKLKDGEVLYLVNNLDNKIIDSTYISNNMFKMYVKKNRYPRLVILRNQTSSLRTSFWIENKITEFRMHDLIFSNAKIIESVTDNLYKKIHSEKNQQIQDSLIRKIEEQKVVLYNKMYKTPKYKQGMDSLDIQLNKADLFCELNFIKEYPNNIISAYLLSFYATTLGYVTTQQFFSELSDDIKASKYGERIIHFLSINKTLKVGDFYVDIHGSDIYGKSRKLSEFNGKIIFLEFWSSWCHSCLEEIPYLVNAYNKYHLNGFEIFGVSADENPKSWRRAISKYNLNNM